MSQIDKTSRIAFEELLASNLVQTDALSKLLIGRGIVTRDQYVEKLSAERALYQKLFNPTVQ